MKHSSFAIAALLLAACSSCSRDFTFVQITDPQMRFTRDTGIEGVSDFQLDSLHLELAVAKINGLSPAFVVVTGDMIHDADSESDLRVYKSIIGKIDKSIPVYHVPGNHDIRDGADDSLVEQYIARFGSDRFSFELKGSRFIGIDSNVIRGADPAREPEQFQWLAGEFAAAKKKYEPVYIFSHCPVFLDNMDEEASYHAFQPEMRRKYWDLFKEGGVKAMIAGHLHYNHTTEFEGIQTVITGPTGYSFEQGGGKEGLRLWTISPDSFTSEFIYLAE